MPSLREIAHRRAALDDADVAWLHLLLADWQIIADLSFADLVLWLPDRDGDGFWAGGQVRPTTAPTAYPDDVIGEHLEHGVRPLIDAAHAEHRVCREGDAQWRNDVPVRAEATPVRHGDRVIAVVARNTNLLGVRTPSRLEISYLEVAGDLTKMIARGLFPAQGQRSDHADTPRVGDGFVRVDARGRVQYASPNALSLYRRLGIAGDLTGVSLADVTRDLVPPRRRPDEETLSAVLGGRAHRDVEIDAGEVALIARSIPLRPEGVREGGLILARDVTALRHRDRELITKDATIREIHHRVKNNLQTVAALLRLQARRIEAPEATLALEEAVRRVGSIAIVHETLSQAVEESVDFDEVVDRLAKLVTDVGSLAGAIQMRREGTFGRLDAEHATPLAMAITELLQNAVEHAYGEPGDPDEGRVVVRADRRPSGLAVTVDDDGHGLPADFDLDAASSLGLSIVRTLVESELGGHLTLGRSPDGGTRADLTVPLG